MKYFTNSWNWVHLAWGFWLTVHIVAIMGMHPVKAAFVTLISDVLKETLDTVAARLDSQLMYKLGFDPAGFDMRDVLMCAVGIINSLFILQLM